MLYRLNRTKALGLRRGRVLTCQYTTVWRSLCKPAYNQAASCELLKDNSLPRGPRLSAVPRVITRLHLVLSSSFVQKYDVRLDSVRALSRGTCSPQLAGRRAMWSRAPIIHPVEDAGDSVRVRCLGTEQDGRAMAPTRGAPVESEIHLRGRNSSPSPTPGGNDD